MPSHIINREISWLSFNERVLQEAEDKRNPLVERMRFLGIFSNNLDEFFRVRVATVRRLLKIQKQSDVSFPESPQKILNRIHDIVVTLQSRFDKIYNGIIEELERERIFIIDESELTPEQKDYVRNYYLNHVEPHIVPIMLRKSVKINMLSDDANYFLVHFDRVDKRKSIQYSLIEIPKKLSRFIVLPQHNGNKYIIYLDDVIRVNLSRIYNIFHYKHIDAHVFKITKDAELDLDDDIVVGFYDKIKKSLENRKKGEPVRFIYDQDMPEHCLKFLMKSFKLVEEESIIPGGRYHNFKDFMKFPNVGKVGLEFSRNRTLKHKYLEGNTSILQAIYQRDVLLHYPYQTFDYVIDMLREAAISPDVDSIQITLYRLADDSKIINALINAAKNGKDVVVVIELQARFDEEANLQWAKVLTDEGVRLILGVPGLKIHSKLILIKSKFDGEIKKIAHIGTGNFHEGTANVYSDISLLTSDDRITHEAEKVFRFIEKPYLWVDFQHLLVSPIYMRNALIGLIDGEIRKAQRGKQGYIFLKLNSLVDETMINKLYEASAEGVKIDLIVRGICGLVPGEEKISENIRAISILDKYLEHVRIFVFGIGAGRKYYLSSADWMTRNLDYRIEVATPVYDPRLKKEIQHFIKIQLSDNVKARFFDSEMSNSYRQSGDKKIRSQFQFYKYLSKR
ncbi:MAG: polyphosphate kinase 1 [Flavobacteriales bacterium]|nr:polyphosphate kinase 1 [Bacteroidota bacterium]MCB9239909.1 polyphosphate kinase 1 [Flavobacteriales bacterium]